MSASPGDEAGEARHGPTSESEAPSGASDSGPADLAGDDSSARADSAPKDSPAPADSTADIDGDDSSAGVDSTPDDSAADDSSAGGTSPDVVDSEGGAEGEGEAVDELAVARAELADRTVDLQRLQAEYANYRKRVERDRQLIAENSTYAALTPIVEVLDTIDRAREHGELDDGLRAVAEQLERVVAGQGLVRFGEAGEAFDPQLHEALSHLGEDPAVEVTTVKVVAKAGYRMGDRVVRAAQVLVVDPAGG